MTAAQGVPRGKAGGAREWIARAARALGRWVLAQTAFLFPFVVSLAANTAAGLRSGSLVLLVAGFVIPTSLFIAVEVWFRMPAAGDAAQWVRLGLMSLPVLVAGAWSWTDITTLLVDQYNKPSAWIQALCFVAPLSIDGLGLLAVYTRTMAARPSRPPRLVPLTVRGPIAGNGNGTAAHGSDRADDGNGWGGPHTVPETVPHVEPAHPARPVPDVPHTPARSLRAVTTSGVRQVGDDLDALSREALRDVVGGIVERGEVDHMSVRGSGQALAERIRTHRRDRAARRTPEPADEPVGASA